MPRPWPISCLLLALLGLAPPVRANAAAPYIETGPSSEQAPASGEDGLLPPGVRPRPDSRVSPAEYGSRSTRRIPISPTRHGGPEWIEAEFTVTPGLEARILELLRDRGVGLGQVILLDPRHGEVFAYVTTDPEAFPATRAYPAASLMKIVTAAAVLENAPQAARRECRYQGSPYKEIRLADLFPPLRGGRRDSFWHAMAKSNNPCFARLAVHDVGREALLGEIARLGLLEAPAHGHPPGRISAAEGDLALGELGSGLSGAFVTPLAAARLAATLAHGEVVWPWWIARLEDQHGRLLGTPPARDATSAWRPEVARQLREMLVGVTEEGTARSAFHTPDGRRRLDPIRVSGKTGSLTGTDPPGFYQWFVGIAPAERPTLAIASVVVSSSAASASDVAAATLEEVFCGGAACSPSRASWLFGRAEARNRAVRSALERQRRTVIRQVTELDEVPRPVGGSRLEFPRELRRKRVDGRIVLMVELNHLGEVTKVEVASSDLPEFEEFVMAEVRTWRFTPPRYQGLPVGARARLPIPIRVQ